MNIAHVVKYGIAFGMIAGSYILAKAMHKGFEKEVDEGLDREVYNKFGEQLKDARNDLVIAKAEHRKLQIAEADLVKERLLENSEYQTAKATVESNNTQIDILEKTLKTASAGNSTQVAVGSGDSAVAVSIKDTGKITQLQTDISKLKAETAVAEATKNRIWKLESAQVAKERTPEDLAIIAAMKEKEKCLTKVEFERNFYRNQLKDNPEFMEAVQKKAFMKTYTPGKQIAVAVLLTIPALISLIDIWYWAINGTKIYLDFKKGV